MLVIGKYNETGGSNDTTLMGRPSEIWVDPADNEVFVADGYGNRRIIVFDGATGKYLRHWGAYGKPPIDPPRTNQGAGAGSRPQVAGRPPAQAGGARAVEERPLAAAAVARRRTWRRIRRCPRRRRSSSPCRTASSGRAMA